MANDLLTYQGEMKRLEILGAIEDYIKEHQYPPSVREIGKMVGLSSTSTIHHHLRILIDEGRLETDRENVEARAIRLPGYRLVRME